jgi:hypothetical protein
MSTSQPNETGASQVPQPSLPGDGAAKQQQQRDERELVKLYMELTAESESQARNVLMFVSSQSEGINDRRPD